MALEVLDMGRYILKYCGCKTPFSREKNTTGDKGLIFQHVKVEIINFNMLSI